MRTESLAFSSLQSVSQSVNQNTMEFDCCWVLDVSCPEQGVT